MKQLSGLVSLLLLALGGRIGARGQTQTLRDGDRVVFYGDSITAQRLYTRFVEDIVLTRNPQLHVTFWNAGVPGDTVYGGYTGDMPARLKRDLLPHDPTLITIMLGMNDGYYMAFNQKYLDIYREGYDKLLQAIAVEAPHARLTLLSPTPYDEITHGTEFPGYNEVISRHAAYVKEVAASSRLAFADCNLAMTELLSSAVKKDVSLAALLIPDRIHPGEASHWIMAAALAKAWGLSPIVSSVSIDALNNKSETVENTDLVALKMNEGKIEWTQSDKALPLPLPLDDGRMQLVLGLSHLGEMDRQMLRVSGLQAAQYQLKIDDRTIGSFTREQLADGVNLALFATPMLSQAQAVDGLELKRTRLDEARFLLAIEDPKAKGNAEAVRAIEEKDALLLAEQRKLAQPKPHQFLLNPM